MDFLGISLSDWSNLATIATGVVAVVAYAGYQFGFYRRRWALEKYLKSSASPERLNSGDQGMRTVLHLASALRMTPEEVMRAAYESSQIAVGVGTDPQTGWAATQLFSYKRTRSADRIDPGARCRIM